MDGLGKRVHLALPIRVTYPGRSGSKGLEMACTYDIHARGARLAGLRNVREVGELITVERGRSKALCQVIWIGDLESELRGQCGIECVEQDKMLWEAELAEAEEVYDPIVATTPRKLRVRNSSENRRFCPRFPVSGRAQLVQDPQSPRAIAVVEDLSQEGCLIQGQTLFAPGSELKLALNITDCSLRLKGRVRHGSTSVGTGIEFREIRKGDRPLLNYLLRKLAIESPALDYWMVEVVAPAL